jgi:aminoglycoside phosphotransferase
MSAQLPELDSVRTVLAPWCEDGDVALDELRIRHIKPSANGSLRALYEAPGPGGQVLRLAARWADPGEGRRLAARLNDRWPGDGVSGFSRPGIYSPALGLLFQVFPADLRLPSLPAAIDPGAMAPVLALALGGDVREVAVDVLRYKPERKCLLRYRLGAEVVYARISRQPNFDRAADNLRRIREADGGGGFDLPLPLALVEEMGMELFSHLPGVPLFTLVDEPAFPALCARTGAAVHAFHALPVTLEAQLDRDADFERLRESTADFAWLVPEQSARTRALAQQVTGWLQDTPPAPARLVHGDFHGDNVLVDGERLGLIDFEDCAMGDPADDVALNWAQLHWYAAKGRGDGRRAFLDAYLRRTDPGTAARLPVRAALQCFFNAYQCARRPQDPERFEDMEIMLRACEDVLAGRAPG